MSFHVAGRMIAYRACCSVLLILVLSSSLSNAADKKQLSVALAAVEANLKTSPGKQYDAEIGKQLSQQHAAAIRQCRQSSQNDGLNPFDIFLKLKADGSVDQALAYPEAPLATCTRDALSRAKFSGPPHDGYWVNIHLELKR
jgi:hypothetical protein